MASRRQPEHFHQLAAGRAPHLAVAHSGHSQPSSPSASSSSYASQPCLVQSTTSCSKCVASLSLPCVHDRFQDSKTPTRRLFIDVMNTCAIHHPVFSHTELQSVNHACLRRRAWVAPTQAPWNQRSQVSQPTCACNTRRTESTLHSVMQGSIAAATIHRHTCPGALYTRYTGTARL